MSRYFFHVHDGTDVPDLQGTELADLKAARGEALRYAGHLLADKPETFWSCTEWTMRVANDNDLTLFELTFFACDAPVVQKGAQIDSVEKASP